MKTTLDTLAKGEKAIITHFDSDQVPLKLIEMGCLPNNWVEVLQIAPLGDPIYINLNDSYLAIRTETAKHIYIQQR